MAADAAGRYPAEALLKRSAAAAREARLAVSRDGRPGGGLAGDLLKLLAPTLRANLRIAPEGVVELQGLGDELLRYVRRSVLPVLREGPGRAYHGWTGKPRRGLRMGGQLGRRG